MEKNIQVQQLSSSTFNFLALRGKSHYIHASLIGSLISLDFQLTLDKSLKHYSELSENPSQFLRNHLIFAKNNKN